VVLNVGKIAVVHRGRILAAEKAEGVETISTQRAQRPQRLVICSACFAGSAFIPSSASSASSARPLGWRANFQASHGGERLICTPLDLLRIVGLSRCKHSIGDGLEISFEAELVGGPPDPWSRRFHGNRGVPSRNIRRRRANPNPQVQDDRLPDRTPTGPARVKEHPIGGPPLLWVAPSLIASDIVND
jgi:hypothetical protein